MVPTPSGVHLLRVLETSNPRCTEGSQQLKLLRAGQTRTFSRLRKNTR